MLEITHGNLLEAPAEALVNTVNTEGVMGKGIALQFKQAFPEMYRDYVRASEAGEIELGKMHVFDLGGLVGGPRWIINFPTKGHWRAKSKLTDIESGLQDLVKEIQRLEIRSIAVPPLGCGNGGLEWSDVLPRIESALGSLSNVKVLVFAPRGAPSASAMRNRTNRPNMTMGQAVLIALMDRYLKGLLDPFVTLLETHKLMYFMQSAGQPLRLDYSANTYGPYAANLRQLLIRMESHYIQGYGDGEDNPTKELELLPGAIDEANRFLSADQKTQQRLDRVAALMEGFEDPLGLELLSSVHWVIEQQGEPWSEESVTSGIHRWNERKRKLFRREHILKALTRLDTKGWTRPSH